MCPAFSVAGGDVFYKHEPIAGRNFTSGTSAIVHCPPGSIPNLDMHHVTCVHGHGWSAKITNCIGKAYWSLPILLPKN